VDVSLQSAEVRASVAMAGVGQGLLGEHRESHQTRFDEAPMWNEAI